jgi:type IV secretory pathway VirB10-like protein
MNEQIKDKAPKPPGLLPKHVQSWLILGLALLMIVIMWLTGGKKQPARAKAISPVPQVLPPVEVNEAKIAELQNRIQELQRQQFLAQTALAEQNKLLGGNKSDTQHHWEESGLANTSGERTEDPIKAERKKREYLSLFASNIALSFRKTGPASSDGADTPREQSTQQTESQSNNTELAALAQLFKNAPGVPGANPVQPTNNDMPPANQTLVAEGVDATEPTRKEVPNVTKPAAVEKNPAVTTAAGKTYVLFEGTFLETVLINRLDGQFSGPVECLLTNPVYSRDRQHLLLPAGTKVLGEAKRVEAFGQTRLAVLFHHLIMPNGFSVSLDQFKGLDQIGDAGLRDKVNNHYFRIFGASLALGAIGAVAQSGTGSALTASGNDLMRQGFASSMALSSERILDRFLNILPTVTIREGRRVKVYLSNDLALPDYDDHHLPSNL